MIFLSHNYKDKDIVEPIAVRLKEIYGEDNVFYDSWSIKPGESIIGKMNDGLTKCKWFFYFISNNSLNSSMVDLEWQTALYKSAKDGLRFIPIKIDECYPPQILLNTLYLDMYVDGFENTIRNLFDLVNGNNSKSYKSKFENLLCTINKISNNELKIKIEVVKLLEPNSSFAFAFSNEESDISLSCDSDSVTYNFSGTINNKNCKGCRVTRVITKGFPYEVTLKSKTGFLNNDLMIWHQVGKEEFVLITNIIEK